MGLISVIIPVYNVELYLKRCIDSVLKQTFNDFEVILVDDGSPDNCGKICDEYALKDSRIKVIHKKNGGLSDARNAALDWIFENSDSEWITCIDSDDWIHPKYLQFLYEAVINASANISISAYQRVSDVEHDEDYINSSSLVCDTDKFYMENIVNATVAWGKLYNRKLFDGIRYPVGKLNEDEFTTYKLLFQVDKIVFIENPLYYYYINDGSIIQSQKWTPKYLHSIYGIEEQLNFFSKADKTDLTVFCVRRLVRQIIYNINLLNRKKNEGDESADKYIKELTLKLRKIISKYKKTADFTIKADSLIFETAYTWTMAVYWKLKSLFKGK